MRVLKNSCLAQRPSSHLVLSLPLDSSVMDSVPLDFSVIDFVPLGTFFRSYNTSSVPLPFLQIFPISNVRVPSWFVSLHSPNLTHFVLLIILVETSWLFFFMVTLFYFVYSPFLSSASSRCIIMRLFCAPPRLLETTLCYQNKFTASLYGWVFNIFY